MLFDTEFKLDELYAIANSTKDKTIDLCTVRSDSIGSSSLGTLFWILVANRFSKNGNHVNIFDFPNNAIGTELLPTETIANILGVEHTYIYRAEELDHSYAKSRLHSLAAKFTGSRHLFPGIHPEVAQGLDNSAFEYLHHSLDRTIEELGVFLMGAEEERRVQILGHEKETVQLIRYIDSPNKQYWKVDIGGIISEFRANKIPTIEEYPSRLIRGQSQGKRYYQFFMFVLNELTSALYELSETDVPMQENSNPITAPHARQDQKIEFILQKTDQINPNLKPYIASILQDKGISSYYFNEMEETWTELRNGIDALASIANPDYDWVLRHLSLVDSSNPEAKGFARNIIQQALPGLDDENLFYHGNRFWKTENRGRAILFFEEYLNREGKERLAEIIELYKSTKGLASKELGSLLATRNLI
ncbi:MAG: hypothetical protein HGA85_04635 [Nanoarchaeota archaeon]|nr:hypothetical protein [Nanoarchaeota archaeon]